MTGIPSNTMPPSALQDDDANRSGTIKIYALLSPAKQSLCNHILACLILHQSNNMQPTVSCFQTVKRSTKFIQAAHMLQHSYTNSQCSIWWSTTQMYGIWTSNCTQHVESCTASTTWKQLFNAKYMAQHLSLYKAAYSKHMCMGSTLQEI